MDELTAHGYAGLRVDRIAQRAGVSKATLYRRWRGRDGLVLDAVEHFGIAYAAPVTDTGNLDDDLRLWTRSIQAMLTDEHAMAFIRAIFNSDAPTSPLRRRFWTARLERARPIVQRAIARHDLPPETDADEVVRHLGAPLYYRLLVLDEPVTIEAADRAAAVTAMAARAGLFNRSTLSAAGRHHQ